ncbi:MAG: DJ-1/PfpI family protein [Anaerolineales bacterium]|jgi:putative intracellular protease/amidase
MLSEGKATNEVQISWLDEIVQKAESQVLILVSDGFDDDPVFLLIIELRRASKSVQVVGLSKKEVRSAQGIILQPDLSLDDVNKVEPGTMLIIPNGRQINMHIKTDPRIHELIKTMLNADNYVIAVPRVVSTLGLILVNDSNRLVSWHYHSKL